METIYTGKEPLLVDTLIERAIKENNIKPAEIISIYVNCYMPKENSLNLWEIEIRIKTTGVYSERYYSKECVNYGYTITYLQHVARMGIKKLKIKELI